MNNIKYFTNENEYIKFLANYKGELLSPGGAANLVNVTRACITNWINRDGKIRAYIYKDPVEGKYIFVDKSDVIRARLETRKRNTIGSNLAERLSQEWTTSRV